MPCRPWVFKEMPCHPWGAKKRLQQKPGVQRSSCSRNLGIPGPEAGDTHQGATLTAQREQRQAAQTPEFFLQPSSFWLNAGSKLNCMVWHVICYVKLIVKIAPHMLHITHISLCLCSNVLITQPCVDHTLPSSMPPFAPAKHSHSPLLCRWHVRAPRRRCSQTSWICARP